MITTSPYDVSSEQFSNLIAASVSKGHFAYSVEQFPKGIFNNSILPSDVKAERFSASLKPLFENSLQGRIMNNDTSSQFGANFSVDALSQFSMDTIKQKFYVVNELSKYVPQDIGIAPFAPSRYTIKEFYGSSNPEDGLISQVNKGQYAEVDTGVDNIAIPREFWAKQISYNYLTQAQMGYLGNGGYDYVASKLHSLTSSYDQFIQKILFYGFSKRASTGLLTNSGVTVNTTEITSTISAMSYTDFNTFISTIMAVYQANNAIGEYPDTFYIPQSDFVGLQSFINPAFPTVGSKKYDVLLDVCKSVTGNANFKILSNFYNQKSFAANTIFAKADGAAPILKDRYVLYKAQKESIIVDMPIPLTTLGTGTLNNLDYVQLTYAQMGQVFVKRTQDMIYFDNPNS